MTTRLSATNLVPMGLLVAVVALLSLGLPTAEATPCKGTGVRCPTNQSCCSRQAVKNPGAKLGTCQPTCRCGDGSRDTACGEQCDDGNTVNSDACTNACTNARCGDGILQTSGYEEDVVGEQCDDGNTDNSDACTTNCTNARCGD